MPHTYILNDVTYEFVGYDGDLEDTAYQNATKFLSDNEECLIEFIALEDDKPLDQYHIEFMRLVVAKTVATYEEGKESIELNIDDILECIVGYREIFDIWVTRKRTYNRYNGFSSLYNTALLVDFSLIAVDSLSVVEPHSLFTYKGKKVARFGTAIERFPSYVSQSILTKELEKVTKKNPLAFKLIDVDRLLNIGLILDRYML